jgi:2-iminobutanoate/2-iminopropanoate deaminase
MRTIGSCPHINSLTHPRLRSRLGRFLMRIEQTRQTIVNLEAILAAAGCTLQHVVKATLYLTDMADYPRVNKVYDQAFAPNKPARTCVAVSALPVRERMKIDLALLIHPK